jgi:hypothetical protein
MDRGIECMHHTYLLQEGLWIASGFYFDETDRLIPMGGETSITHRENLWLLQSTMRILLEEPTGFHSDCEIIPFLPGRNDTTWQSLNPAVGKLLGRFVIVDDSILSFFQSEDGRFTGAEYLLKMDDATYRNRGVLFEGDRKGSSWIAEMRKAP